MSTQRIVVFPQECRIAVGGRVFVQFLGLLGGHMCLLNISLVVIRIAAVVRVAVAAVVVAAAAAAAVVVVAAGAQQVKEALLEVAHGHMGFCK